jgi:hypothetical protein
MEDTDMITIFAAEQRGGFITMTETRDGLPPDAIRTSTRVFPTYDDVLATAEMYFNRGFSVSVYTKKHGNVDYEQ